MTMTAKGLAKLLEELGELGQVAAKKLAYFDTDVHPDGAGPLSERMEQEMADVQAAIEFVAIKFNLDFNRIGIRRQIKLQRFKDWDLDPADAVDQFRYVAGAALCPHGFDLRDNTCGPCSQGRPMSLRPETFPRPPQSGDVGCGECGSHQPQRYCNCACHNP